MQDLVEVELGQALVDLLNSGTDVCKSRGVRTDN